MWCFECPTFKEFRDEDIVCKSIKFHFTDEMQSSVMVTMYMDSSV